MITRTIWTLMILPIFIMTMAACGLLQEPAAPSEELEAVPLELEGTETTGDAGSNPAAAEEPALEEVEETVVPEENEEIEETPLAEEAMVEEPETEAEPAPEETEASNPNPAGPIGDGLLIYTIDPAASTVRFELDEVLRGNPVTVVGLTDQVSGEIGADLNDLSSAQVGMITINARTLATDNNFRNRAIQNEILDTGEFEFITFTATMINDLPAAAVLGETVTFTIDGDLTIRDMSAPATFAVTATPTTETQLSGTASTIISREDFNLTIPEVPGVANVEPEVELYIDFVANAS